MERNVQTGRKEQARGPRWYGTWLFFRVFLIELRNMDEVKSRKKRN